MRPQAVSADFGREIQGVSVEAASELSPGGRKECHRWSPQEGHFCQVEGTV